MIDTRIYVDINEKIAVEVKLVCLVGACASDSEWLCCDCIAAVFPSNNIEEDHEFLASINNIDTLV